MVAFVTNLKAEQPELTTSQCVAAIEARFGVKVHRRSLERAMARKKKSLAPSPMTTSHRTANDYEKLRAAVLRAEPVRGPGLGILRHRGLTSWLNAPIPEPIAQQPGAEHDRSSGAHADPAPPTSRTHPPHRRHRRRHRSGARPCLISRSPPIISGATPISMSASRRCARSPSMVRARSANMRLRDRAIAAGWPIERVRVIDRDLGKSGSSAAARDGFQELVSEVALGKAGIVMGLEVSRLARNSADWHRLIELCALTATLILDEDGIYDPAGFNDRLLLGLKGTMSEAELHILKARMRGGQLNKARRGELEMRPPVGLVYRTDGVNRPRSRRPGAGRHPSGVRDLRAHRQRHADRPLLPGARHPVPAPAACGAEQG